MPKKILICDDAQLTRKTLRNILEENGYVVIGEAVNGKEAVAKFKELQPDLTFMDIVMPEMDGIEAVNKIMEVDSNALVIMCSSLAQQKKVVCAIRAGAKDFIVKPFTPERVLDSIRKNLICE
ncbi:MAG TPA: response regulator [Lachnospiraceae bacterium]|nr:response regulator [Lachnospiraceae bacterium]